MVMGSLREETEVAVIGAGPGGYVAAIRAADLGKEVLLIDDNDRPGGVCLLEGCIPSKTLIHAVEVINSARDAGRFGISFGEHSVDLKKLREWTDSVVGDLTNGIKSLLKRRGIEVIKGKAVFDGAKSLAIEGADVSGIDFRKCIIAAGSRINEIPPAYKQPVWSSAEALKLPEIPERLIVVGGGYIGLEMGLVYAGLGTKITVVEFSPALLGGADQDLVKVVLKHCKKRFHDILFESKVTGIEKTSNGFAVEVEHKDKTEKLETDQVLVAVGRKPNTDRLRLEKTKITPNDHGFIETDEECRTAEPDIFAIGDVATGPMLAHKASREGKVAAEVIAEHKSAFDNRAIPAVVFTEPELAWAGLTETEAAQQNIKVNVGRFPLKALGRARSLGQTDGFVKVISEPETNLVLGVGMVGPQVSDLIAEGALALEMGAALEDIMVTIHPHPTLSEALMEAAEVAAGAPVHIAPQKKKK